MTESSALQGRILTPAGWRRGRIDFGARIERIEDDGARGDADERIVLPGFIDLHVHGAAGVDLMQGLDVARTIARAHVRYGTTALLGTTMTAQDILEGRMNVEIGMAVVRPAEFVVLRFSHKMQES